MQPADAAAETGYAAVWRPGGGAQWWKSGMTVDEFKAQDQTYFNQGLRITTMDIDNGKFAAVWRPGSGAQCRSPTGPGNFSGFHRRRLHAKG